ncbi:unnamed protein product [Lepeophtheirus salmonis]|uniref:(salmon louse) hypothetical protein n=1 Tax=Lepeophtheirus salmonis TaxID=72036 RepID=A0A7R8H8C5_LEPSM|nr:unnamed protein product [Lepeophtheirus salmonis]CAF2920639.1 unnamed protein product [Lepeophtheirus salmonis]
MKEDINSKFVQGKSVKSRKPEEQRVETEKENISREKVFVSEFDITSEQYEQSLHDKSDKKTKGDQKGERNKKKLVQKIGENVEFGTVKLRKVESEKVPTIEEVEKESKVKVTKKKVIKKIVKKKEMSPESVLSEKLDSIKDVESAMEDESVQEPSIKKESDSSGPSEKEEESKTDKPMRDEIAKKEAEKVEKQILKKKTDSKEKPEIEAQELVSDVSVSEEAPKTKKLPRKMLPKEKPNELHKIKLKKHEFEKLPQTETLENKTNVRVSKKVTDIKIDTKKKKKKKVSISKDVPPVDQIVEGTIDDTPLVEEPKEEDIAEAISDLTITEETESKDTASPTQKNVEIPIAIIEGPDEDKPHEAPQDDTLKITELDGGVSSPDASVVAAPREEKKVAKKVKKKVVKKKTKESKPSDDWPTVSQDSEDIRRKPSIASVDTVDEQQSLVDDEPDPETEEMIQTQDDDDTIVDDVVDNLDGQQDSKHVDESLPKDSKGDDRPRKGSIIPDIVRSEEQMSDKDKSEMDVSSIADDDSKKVPIRKKSYKELRDEQRALEEAQRKPSVEEGSLKENAPGGFLDQRRSSKDTGESPSVSLVPQKLSKFKKKYSAVEDQTACCYMFVAGNPAPTFKFFKGSQNITEGGRYKLVSDGDNNNMVMMAITKVKANDEAEYKLVIENCHGSDEKTFMLFVSDASGMDFRSMLKKKKYAKHGNDDDGPDWGSLKHNEEDPGPVLKKVEKKSDEWIEPLKDTSCKAGKDKKVILKCRFSKENCKNVKWFFKRDEIFQSQKYKMSVEEEGFVHTLVINNPNNKDLGKYICDIGGINTSCYIDVEEADPDFKFTKPLLKKNEAFRTKEKTLKCAVNSTKAKIKWYKGDKEIIIDDDKYSLKFDILGNISLTISNSQKEDMGTYKCKIEGTKQITKTVLSVEDEACTFTKCLKSRREEEHSTFDIECAVEHDYFEPTWWFNDIEITPTTNKNFDHFEFISEEFTRILRIKDCPMEADGTYKCTTNVDETQCKLIVIYKNKFIKELEDVTGYETYDATFQCQIQDEQAEVQWYFRNELVQNSEKFEVKALGQGIHQLIVKNCSFDNKGAGVNVTCGERLKSHAKLDVKHAEERPDIDAQDQDSADGRVKGKYRVTGRKSNVVAKIFNENGIEIPKSEYELELDDEEFAFKLNNHSRDRCGKYKIVFSNDMGTSEKEIYVNFLDKPTPPLKVKAREVFKDSVTLEWEPPEDDGGTDLLFYVIEKMDLREKGIGVKAVNKIGPSDPGDLAQPILIKDPWDPPGPPINVEPTDWDIMRVDLQWEPPEWDGGSPVLQYLIECREQFSTQWVKCHLTKNNGTKTSITEVQITEGLEENKSYEFRIKAINKAGEGVPSEPTKLITCKSRFLRPFIFGDGMRDIVIKCGQTLSWDISYGGEPDPEAQWFLNDNPIVPDDEKITIAQYTKNIVITIRKCLRKDQGTYKLVLTNSSGKCEEEADGVVLGKPAMPLGPLMVLDLREKHATLNWNYPKDDGGTPITHFSIEKMDIDTGRWVPCGETGPDDDTFRVDGLTRNKKYKFRVRAVNKEGESDPLECEGCFEAKNPYKEPHPPRDVEIDDYDNESVTLKWLAPISDGGRTITHYVIEQKGKYDLDFVEVMKTEDPSKLEATVMGLKEKQTYEFRVKAVNKAGPSLPSEPTPKHICKYKNRKPSIIRDNLRIATIKVGKSHIWSVDVIDHERIAITNEDYNTTFSIKNALRKDTGKYLVKAENVNGFDEEWVELVVLGRPACPEGPLKVSNVTAEGCRLSWKPPLDDGGMPVQEYDIEKFCPKKKRWIKIGKVSGEKDPLNYDVSGLEEGEEYLFRVTAVNDEGESEPLEADAAVKAKNPWNKPSQPDTPEIADYDNTSVDLIWKAPTSDGGSPITHYIIQKKLKGQNDWENFNKGGESPPSDPTGMHKVKHRKLKPRIDRTNLVRTVVKVGKDIILDVDIIGEPAPEIKWVYYDSKIAIDDDNIEIVNEEYNTKFVVKKSVRKNSKRYKVTATNKHGSDEETVELVVLGCPTPPMGPLESKKIDKATGKWTPVSRTDADVTDCKVKGLQEGHEYLFRVKAITDEGESEPLVADAYIVAKDPYGLPDPPRNVQLCDWDADRMDLQWDFFLCKAEGAWTDVGKSDGPKRFFSKGGLVKGKKYQFRVRSVNKAGPSEPSEPTPLVAAKPRKLAPIINRDQVFRDKIWCRKGQALKLEDIDIEGEPAPKVTWTFNGLDQSKLNNVTITNPEYKTSIVIKNAERKMTGMYKITAVNEHGKDECEVEFIVLGPPGPPEGPLEVSDVHKEGCKLKWNPPLDDGGSPIECYLLEKMDIETGNWVPCGQTKNEDGESEPLVGPSEAILIKDPFDPPGPPGLPDITDWTESSVKLKWAKPLRENGAPVTNYTMEYRIFGTDEWVKGPRVKAKKFPDGEITGLEPGKKYEFRVKAEEKQGWSRTNLDTKTVKVNQQVVIEVDVTGEPAPDTAWFFNGEEIKNTDTKKCAHSSYHTKLMLVPAKREMIGKYTITAKNNSGEDKADVEIIIKGKPLPPEGPLEISDVTKNKCKLKWKKPKDDGGSPIEYYEIEKLDPNSGMWVPAGTSPTCEAEVKGLGEGKEYKFRVRAVNKDGESAPLEAEDSIIAKNPFDPPGKPDKPEPLDWGPDFVDLKWKSPKDDGGSPITGYVIEMRDKDKRAWKEVLKTNGTTLTGRIESPAIQEDHEYEFRVIAENKAGLSEASDPSFTIKARVRFLKPRIDRSTLIKKVLRVGQLMRIDADYIGEPDPTITWFFPNGDKIKGDDRNILETDDYHTSLVIKHVEKKDAGIYKIIAKNDQGTDTADVEVAVVSVSGKPIGPIDVSNVTANSCHLEWKPPKDDGGDPIKYYTVEKMDVDKGIWLPCGETLGKTPEFDVNGLTEGSLYMFRVRAVNNEGESEPLETEAATLAKNPFDPPGPPESVKLDDWDRRWKEEFSSKYFKHMETETDECKIKVTDLTENSKYKFRVKAVNKVGAGPPSEPSEEVTFRIGEPIKLNIKVTGEPPAEKVWFLNNTIVKNSPILSITNEDYMTRFYITNAKRGDSGTYMLTATNKNGEDEADLNILVVGPPSKPQGPLKIEDIFADRCKVEWKVPKDDGGCPITHYIVEKCDIETGHWVPCGKSSELFCNIEPLEENHEYMFRVKAVNVEGESESLEGLDSIIAKNPFDPPGPPGKPSMTDWDWDHFDLKWEEPRYDGGSNITSYIIEKMLSNDDLWTKCGEIKPKLEFGAAKGVDLGETYNFRIRAVNAAGPGNPGPESDNLTCRYKKLKPRINRKCLIELTVKVGETIQFDVDIQGEPPPDVTWCKDGKTLTDNELRRIINKPYKTHINIDEATRKDDGIYLLSAVNIHGKDAAEVRVNVIARPGMPEGPLEVSGVHKNGCKIAWKPPKDDGGLPINHYIVEKLDTDTEYKFRVRAVNDEGESDNLMSLKPIVAKDPFDVPLPPSAPDVFDWSENHMELEWKEPIDDGGAPITGYIIEKRSRNDPEWVHVQQIDGNRCKGTANHLIEGEEYQFRIIALNKAGPSEPGQPSRYKEARARFMPPKIERKHLHDITVSAGEMLKFEANIIGEPPADVTWKKEGKEIKSKSDKSLVITNVPYNTKLIIRSCKKSDEGSYNVIAKNSVGKDSVTVNLKVLDKPGPPQGPLKMMVAVQLIIIRWKKLDPDTGLWMPCGRSQDCSLDVKGLKKNKKYKFRVAAVNEEGESLPLDGDEEIEAKDPYDSPSGPQNLELVDYDRDSVDLKWIPPIDNGGSAITGYLIEKKDKYGKWERAHEVPGSQNKCTVPNLVEGETYEFRVRAINAGGIGDSSNVVGPVTCKPRNLPPRIDRSTLLEVHCHAGDSFNFDVNVSGEPAPETQWLMNNKEIESSEKILITVIDVPGAPMGPLMVKDMNAKGCTLEWKPPKDNGGMPIQYYIVEKCDESMGGRWTHAGQTDGPLCDFDIDGLTENHRYKFRVRAVNKQGKSEPLVTSGSYVAKNPYEVPSKPGRPDVIDFDIDWAELEWDKPEFDGGNKITGYIIEKRDKNNPRWEVCGSTEGPGTTGRAKKIIDGVVYEFRVKAVNKAGESDPSNPSYPHRARAKNSLPKIDRMAMMDITILAGTPLTINVPVDGEPPPKKKWTKDCSSLEDGIRVTIVNEEYKTSIRISESKRSDKGIYELVATNINGTDKAICNVTVLDVPGPPDTLDVKDVHKDYMVVTWKPPKDNGGSEIKQYIFEKQDQSNMRWIPCGETKNLRIRAVNSQGEGGPLIGPSTPVVACDPYKLPGRPGKPHTEDWDSDRVDLHWQTPKYDGGSPIKKWIIEKKTRFGIWDKACEIHGSEPKGRVTGLTEGTEYEFRIIAVNEAGPGEPGEPSDPITAEARFVHPSIDLTAMQDMVVCASQCINYTVPILGSPKPEVTWKINDSIVKQSELRNEIGTSMGRAKVTVLDRPSPPQGPLRLSGVTANSCKLNWNESLDDGGSPITHYLIEKMDLSRGSWVEVEITTDLKTIVTGLVFKKEYLMRVKAVNAIGESDPLPLDKSFIARNESDVPDPPGKPEAFDWDRDHIDLRWSRPISDGGSPIEGYIIEKRPKGTNSWTDCKNINGDINKGTASNLYEDEFYQFRIIAFNDAGQSEPGEPSGYIQARPRYLAPKILTPLKDINVKAGNNFTIDVEYIGSPDPSVNWYIEGCPLVTDDERITISAIAPVTTFHIVNCKRTDSGETTIKLVNESGSDKDNGGSDITSYVIEKKDLDHAGGWVPAVNFVEPYTFTHRVPRLLEGTSYEFRVFAVNAQGRSIPLASDEPVTARAQYDVPGKPGRPQAVDADITFIRVSWRAPANNGGSKITGYDVERRDLLGGRWIRVSTRPVSSTEFMDSDVTEGHQYEYKVRAHNAAGPGVHSDPSLPITARPMKAAPKLDLDVLNKRIRVHAGEYISVDIPFLGSPVPNVEWTKEGKRIVTNRFNSTVSPDAITFDLQNSTRLDTGKYKINVDNEFGSDCGYLTVTVVDRPEPPVGPVQYQNIDRETVKILWNPPEDDGGSEVTGYIIEKCDYGSNDWIACPGYAPKCEYIARNLFEGRKYVFRIRAENAIGVSDALVGKHIEARSPYDPPGPPGQPQITSYSPSSASLSWTPPTETGGREITGYFVEKRELGSSWVRVNQYPSGKLNYIVPGLIDGTRYEFRIIACNEAGPGLPSKSSEPITASVQKFKPGPPEGLNPDRITKNSVTLSWRPPRDDGGCKIKGYIVQQKHKDQSDFIDINTYPHNELSYTVSRLSERQEYSFRVIAVNEMGQSEPSKATPNLKLGEQPNQPKIDLGYPKPTAQLWNEDTDLKGDSRVIMQVTEEFVSIIVKKSTTSDAGHYRLKLANDSGYDTATFNVSVLDRPSKPWNIYATDFAGEAFDLHWSPPLNNGGSPITNYIIEKCEQGKSWQRVSSFATSCHSRIRNLTVNKEYDFRIYAENQYGISDPGENVESIRAKHPFDPPGPPGQPQDIGSTSDSISIQWTRPRNDGGSYITGYIVEKRQVSGSWSKACHQTVSDITLKVIGLQENNDYEFHVAAINAAGQGPWGPVSEPIRCSPAKCAPKITSDLNLRDMTVIAGHDISITVPFFAIPQPKAKWSINGYEVSDERVRIEINDHEAHFYANKRAKRSDTGNYNIQLINSEGSDQGSCRVLVVDRPSPPLKPFDAYDITPDSCTLSWRPPSDDGGSSITNYVIDKFDISGGYWTKICSFIRGLHYDVLGLEANKKYSFQVRAENQYGISDPLELEEPITAKFPFTVPDPPSAPKVLGDSPTSVNLSWDRPFSDGGSKIQGYKVEYREVIEEQWVVCSTTLIRSQTHIATNLITGSEYEFRVKAVNAAGESKPSPPSQRFRIKAKATPPGPPGTPIIAKIGKNTVDLKWSKPSYDGGAKVTGYIVEQKEYGSSIWTRCNDYEIPTLEYGVFGLNENMEYEFRVIAVNSAGKSDPSTSTGYVRIGEVLDGSAPDFTKYLHNAGAGLGQKIILACVAEGKPMPKYKWMRNGRDVSEQPGRIIMTESNGKFTLTITELWEIDEGEYVFGAPPKIEQIPSDLHLPEGDNSKIKIKWSGDFPVTVELFFNGSKVSESSHIKMTTFDEFLLLFLRDIKRDMAGKYTVKVTNDSGSVEGSFIVNVSGLPGPPIGPLEVSEISSHTCQLHWHLPEYDGGSKITHYVVERQDIRFKEWIIIASFCKSTHFAVQGLTEGQEYNFRILASNANGNGPPLDGINPVRAKPPYDAPSSPGAPKITEVGSDFVNLTWERPEFDGGSRIKGYWIEKKEIGSDLWQKVNQFINSSTQINICNLIENRRYEFRVFAENEAGLSKPSSNSQSVIVKDPEDPEAPEILTPLKNTSCVEEKNARFTCKITGVPKPKVLWYKGARELFDSGKHEITSSGGSSTSKADLKIKTAPHLNVPPRFRDSAFFDKGENAVMKVPFTGNPKPRITWKRDGEIIESGGHFQVKTEERHALITIMDVNKSDSGPYSITAENELGTDYALINVQVSDQPDPPRWPVTSQIGTDSLVLEWQVPAWDGGSAITNYIVEKQELPMTSWTRVGHTRFNLIPITDLVPGNEYKFRVFAENVYGRSNPSDESPTCQTKGVLKKKQPKTKYEVDPDTGKKIRGQKCEVKDYDQFVFDIYSKFIPQPVEIKTQQSVYDNYDILEEIGTGAFGVVHRCRESKTGQVYAAKFIPISHAMEKALIRKEIDIMNHLHHNKLINLHDAYEDEEEMVLIFEFLSGGELFEKITSEGYTMSEAEVINYMRQICEGVKFMHERNIIHLDIKPENVMCQTSKSTNVKLIDFGLATKLDPNELVKISTGTAEFAAPEIVEREPVGFYTDMWSIGVLSYVLLSGLSPFAGSSDIETLRNVKACDWEFDEEAF